MNIHFTFKNMEPSDSLKTFIQEKSQTLKKYFNGKISITWVISMEKVNRIAHCHMVGNSMDYFGEGSTTDFKASIEIALDKVEKQVRRHKEIVKNHLHKHEYKSAS